MRFAYLKIIMILLITTVSCIKVKIHRTEKDCSYAKSLALSEINNGNLKLYLTGKKYFLISNYIKYYIWEKYKVNIDDSYALSSLTKTDSCYFEIMKQHVINYQQIINDIDSLFLVKSESENPERYVTLERFHDGKYDFELYGKDKKYMPTPKDSLFEYKLDCLIGSFSSEIKYSLESEFWYVVDTLGNVKDIEFTLHSTTSIDNEIKKFFYSTKFKPANNGIRNIEYRGLKYIYIHSVTKKTKEEILSYPMPIE